MLYNYSNNEPEIRPNLSGSHIFSLTATAEIRFAMPAEMLFTKRNENRA